MNTEKVKVAIDKSGVEYIQPCHIRDKFDLSRATVHRLLTDMKSMPKYRKSFVRLSYRLSLVKLKDFRQFLTEQDHQYLKEGEKS